MSRKGDNWQSFHLFDDSRLVPTLRQWSAWRDYFESRKAYTEFTLRFSTVYKCLRCSEGQEAISAWNSGGMVPCGTLAAWVAARSKGYFTDWMAFDHLYLLLTSSSYDYWSDNSRSTQSLATESRCPFRGNVVVSCVSVNYLVFIPSDNLSMYVRIVSILG